MKKNDLLNVMNVFGELYDKKISTGILEIYYEIFKEYDIKQFKNAAYKVIKTHQYNTLPKPAHIIEYLEGTKDDKALVGWMTAIKGRDIVGYYDSPIFVDDPIISHCINRLGGWKKFCSILEKDIPFIEKRFTEIYKIFEKREINEPIELNKKEGLYDHSPKVTKIKNEENSKLEQKLLDNEKL